MKKVVIAIGIIIVVGLLGAGGYYFKFYKSSKTSATSTGSNTSTSPVASGPKIYTAQEFVNLWYSVSLPNIKAITTPPPITGDAAADKHIVALATARGYRLQSLPTISLVSIGPQLVQPQVLDAWQKLTADAAKQSINFSVASGYRSIELQTTLFKDSLAQNGFYTNDQIVSGLADTSIQKVLDDLAPPGFSKEHTGYAMDVTQDNLSLDDFKQSKGFKWLSDNNYANSRKYGFIPAYPDGANKQGPLSEAWELVWVGTDNIKN